MATSDDPSSEAFAIVYDRLRALADRRFQGAAGQAPTLQPTALVHEAYLKLASSSGLTWNDEEHFCAVAATAMRQILTDYARQRSSVKRGGQRARVTLGDVANPEAADAVDLLALDEALQQLAELDARQARIVELRFFGGLTNEQAAHALGVSRATVENDWRRARAWLIRTLEDPMPDDA